MADITGGYWSPYPSPTSYFQLSYAEIARNGSSVTYRVTLGINLGSSQSYFGYAVDGHFTINGVTDNFNIKGTEGWSGTTVHWFTRDITCPAGSSGGTLPIRFWTTRSSGTALIIDLSGTVNLSTWNTAPYWPSDAACTVSPSGTIPENTASLTVSWAAANDTEGNTRYYTVKRYKNGSYDATIATNITATSVSDNIGSGNQGVSYYYTVEVNDGSLTQSAKLQSATVTKNTFTGASITAGGNILYSTSTLAMTISGAKNTNGNTLFTYSLACDKVTVYNPTASPGNVTIYKSGALPTGTYIKFDDIKTALAGSGYKGNFVFTLTTTNAYGSVKTATATVYVDITTTPTAVGAISVTGTFKINDVDYFVPGKRDITVTWGASSDPLGGSITYELQGKIGYDNFVTLATGITGTTKTVSLAAVTAQTTYVFRVIAKTSYGTSVVRDAAEIALHYYYTPSVIFDPVVRNINDAIISGTINLNTSIPGTVVTALSYAGKTSGNLTLATTFTKQETGLLETDTFNFEVTVRDSAGDIINGLTGVTFSKSVPRYTPHLSVRKKGIGINALADDTYKFVVGVKTKFTDVQMTALRYSRIYNNVAEISNTASSITGTLKITMPKSWTSTMMYLSIKGYSYNSIGAWELLLGGYNYVATPAWYNTSATLLGSAPFTSVRFAHDGTKCCILLGTTSTVWDYPKLIIEQLVTTFGYQDGWESGWGFTWITSETGITVTSTPTINLGFNVDTVDGKHASDFALASNAVPAGATIPFAGSSAPTGWLICNGAAISRTTYSALFAIIGTTYGVGDGSTTFNIPDLRGRVPVGYNSTETEFNALNKTGGEKTHKLTVSELAAHEHEVVYANSLKNLTLDGGGSNYNIGWSTSGINSSNIIAKQVGGDGGHNNLQPYITLNYIIKY